MAVDPIAIGDALVLWLNDAARAWATPPEAWTAARGWDETLDVKDPATAATPIVQVVMEGTENGRWETRVNWREDHIGFIGVRQRYATSGAIPVAWIDDRVKLLIDIHRQMRRLDLSASFGAGYKVFTKKAPDGVNIAVLRDRIDQEVFRQYTGIVEFKIDAMEPSS